MASINPDSAAPSPDLVPVQAIIPEQRPGDGAVLVMRDASFRLIMRTGAVNFDMKSSIEQGGLTWAFGALVDSLDVEFPIQIVSHSKLLDIDAYTRQYEPRLQNDRTPPPIRKLIRAHIDHFEQQVKTNKLLQRELYVVLPFKGTGGPLKPGVSDEVPFAGFFKSMTRSLERKVTQHAPTDMEIATARQQLEIRSDQLVDRFEQMGIWARRLNEGEVTRLLYQLYHPSRAERQTDPGFDQGGRLFGGFSAEGTPTPRRRIGGDHEIAPPDFE